MDASWRLKSLEREEEAGEVRLKENRGGKLTDCVFNFLSLLVGDSWMDSGTFEHKQEPAQRPHDTNTACEGRKVVKTPQEFKFLVETYQ